MNKERRKSQFEASAKAVELLSSAQSYALGELSQQGGELAFARQAQQGHLAVVEIQGRLVTIDSQGNVDQNPDIKTRAT